MIIFAVGSASSIGEGVLNLLSKSNYKIIATYNNKKPKLLKKHNIQIVKFNLNSASQLKKIIKKYKLENNKILLINFAVVKNNKLLIDTKKVN